MRDTAGRIVSVDLRYRGVDYRINDSIRQYGVQIMPAGDVTDCWTCPRKVKPASKIVRLAEPPWWQCVPCSIQLETLVPLPSDDQPKPTPGPFAHHDAANEAWTVARAGEGTR